jgi:NAD(P)H-dependent FMN reductase
MNIEIISSSPRQNSLTNRVALHLQQYFTQNSTHNIGLIDVRDWNLGMLQNVFSSIENTPEKYKPLAEKMFAANAFILVTPEYNGSYSAALNNLFDHFPKQARKTFGLATASVGAMGGMRATQQLLLLVPALYGVASSQLLVTPFVDKKLDVNGNLLDATFEKNIQTFATEFLWLAESLNANN